MTNGRSLYFHQYLLLTLMFFVLFSANPVVAQEKEATEDTIIKTPEAAITQHSLKIGDKEIKYKTIAQYYRQNDDEGKPLGYIYHTAYIRTDVDNSNRPLTFCFNGGPGSSSIYLHLLTIGPAMAALKDDGNTTGPPPRLKDNPQTWLEFTDLVFIDPIGTGYSFPHPKTDEDKYWGAQGDAASVADFIRMFLTENNRWLSPVFIAGESYGGVRGALLAEELQNNRKTKLNVNGIIFVSPAFDWQSLATGDGHNPLYFAQYLPTFAATAYYHKKLEQKYLDDFELLLGEVREFSEGQYLQGLIKGDRLKESEKEILVKKFASFTGLEESYIKRKNLRITSPEFREELLKEENISLDRLDSRWVNGEYELTTTLSPVLNHYLKNNLNFQADRPYQVSGRLGQWTWGDRPSAFSVVPNLAKTIKNNPAMKVLVTAGYYDYACPFGTIDYALDNLLLPEKLRGNISRKYYHAGHMVYTPKDDLIRFTRDVKEFIEGAVK